MTGTHNVVITVNPWTGLVSFVPCRDGAVSTAVESAGGVFIAWVPTTLGWSEAIARAATDRFGRWPAHDVGLTIAALDCWLSKWGQPLGIDPWLMVVPGLIPPGPA